MLRPAHVAPGLPGLPRAGRAQAAPPAPEEVAADLARVHGAWPAPPADRLALLVACDGVYLGEYATHLARSLDRHSPGCHLHLHLFDAGGEVGTHLTKLRNDLAHTTLSETREQPDFTGRSAEFRRTYYASVRFVRLYQFLCAAQVPILMLDADALVRGDLHPLHEAMTEGGHDLAVHTRFWNRKRRERFFAVAVYAAPTRPGRAFLGAVAARIAARIRTGRARWFLDQQALYDTWRSHQKQGTPLALHHLPDAYADWRFHKRSVVWTPRGAKKETDDTYLAARALYAPGDDPVGAKPMHAPVPRGFAAPR